MMRHFLVTTSPGASKLSLQGTLGVEQEKKGEFATVPLEFEFQL